eukprot:132547-Prymnesium_polylepis.1
MTAGLAYLVPLLALFPISSATVPGSVSTLAGSGSADSADGTGTAASFDNPYYFAVTPDGATLYVAALSRDCSPRREKSGADATLKLLVLD